MTLTTFAEVPWNVPYYERCGFRRLGEPAVAVVPSGGLLRWRSGHGHEA